MILNDCVTNLCICYTILLIIILEFIPTYKNKCTAKKYTMLHLQQPHTFHAYLTHVYLISDYIKRLHEVTDLYHQVLWKVHSMMFAQ
jgi:hypothetical protein